MIKEFIENHRKLSATIVVMAVVLLIGVVFVLVSNTQQNASTINPNAIVGDSDADPVIHYKNSLYSIEGDVDNPHNITITAYSGYRNAAVNKLYELGLNPTDYKITFNYESPFKSYE